MTTQTIEIICAANAAGYKRGLAADPQFAQSFARESVKVYDSEDLKTAFQLGFQGGLKDGRSIQDVTLKPEVADALLTSLRSYQEGFKAALLLVIDDHSSVLEAVARAQEIGDHYQLSKGQPYCDGFRAILRVIQRVVKQPQVTAARLRILKQVEDGTLRSTPIVFATREPEGAHGTRG